MLEVIFSNFTHQRSLHQSQYLENLDVYQAQNHGLELPGLEKTYG